MGIYQTCNLKTKIFPVNFPVNSKKQGKPTLDK